MKTYLTGVALGLVLVPSLAAGHGFSTTSLDIVHPFLRETPPGAKTGAGYVIVKNNGTELDRLLAIETEADRKSVV